ncbi:hypothetical protein GS429_06350 [Natronorubrum sp. JWXQ-INN-674]|uniref:CARDB domain-containing protein n=1 Tax=Natronorubrum halalkaliphilum TaxID=2691917 RepID=A0A6B0VJH1_9EURY|nr:hypothetical protein [Natronorubrum halalkaliphilum]MXV61690.1 hypothetical protein [Natronorubrum halalkaliphilum]
MRPETVATTAAFQETPIAVTILETNTPVETGAVLEVTAEVENGGTDPIDTAATLVVGDDPTVVDNQSVEIEPGATATVDLSFETATVANDQEFPVWVVVDDAVDRTSAFVYVDEPPVDVTVLETNDPVVSGEFLEVTARIENESGSETTRDVSLVVGHDPQEVDSEAVTVGADEATTVTLGFQTAAIDTDQEFPVRVETGTETAEQSVLVYADEPTVPVDILRTNDPVAAGEFLEVTVQLENTAESAVTEEIALIVGHDPQQVDSELVTLDPGLRRSVSLGFETAVVESTQEFPIRVESDDAAAERTVQVLGTDDDPVETDVTFPSCTRAEVSGTFGAGDNVAASTGFYDETGGEPLYGNTRMEDWIEIGTHVDPPFSGTIVFEIGEERSVSETDGGIRVEVPAYGDLGTVLSGITLPEDYATATITHGNPQAGSCLDEIADDGEDEDETDDDETDDDDESEEAALDVSITGTNAPVQAGEFLEVTAQLTTTGGETVTQTVSLVVGHDPQTVDSSSVTLEPGTSQTVTLGYETYGTERTTEFPARVESEDDSDVRSVEVVGTGEEPNEEVDDGPEAETDEEPEEESDDDSDGEPTEEPDTETDDEPAEEPREEPDDGPDTEPDDGPTEEPPEEPDDGPDEESTEEPDTEPDDEPAEEPPEEPDDPETNDEATPDADGGSADEGATNDDAETGADPDDAAETEAEDANTRLEFR